MMSLHDPEAVASFSQDQTNQGFANKQIDNEKTVGEKFLGPVGLEMTLFCLTLLLPLCYKPPGIGPYDFHTSPM